MSSLDGRAIVVALAAFAALGCASTPPPQVETMRNRLDALEANQDVGAHASVELVEARKAVTRLEGAAARDREDAIDHLAYLAERRIEIAKTAASAGAFQAEIDEIADERDRLRMQARTREAEQARALAERRGEEAQAARRQANSALERARELEGKLSELKAEQTERGLVLTLSDVLFGFDKAELQPGAKRSLSDVAEFLNEYGDRRIAIEGHTDNVGPEEYNRELSKRRADRVADFLKGEGVEPSRIRTSGLGESAPVAPNEAKSGRQQNRRVEIILQGDG